MPGKYLLFSVKAISKQKEITLFDSKSLQTYFKEVSKFKVLNIEEEIELAIKARQGNSEALKLLINSNLRFVITVAKKYQNMGISLEDLINEGNIGLITAAKKFDPGKGYKFITYAVFWIRQAIIGSIENNARTIRLSHYMAGVMRKVERVTVGFQQTFHRSATIEEIVELSGICREEVEQAWACRQGTLSIDIPTSADAPYALADVMEDVSCLSPDVELEHTLVKDQINHLIEGLEVREQMVVTLLFGLNNTEPMKLHGIADALKISHERVRQIRNNIMKKLKHRLADLL